MRQLSNPLPRLRSQPRPLMFLRRQSPKWRLLSMRLRSSPHRLKLALLRWRFRSPPSRPYPSRNLLLTFPPYPILPRSLPPWR